MDQWELCASCFPLFQMWVFIMDIQVQLHYCIWEAFVWERINCILFLSHQIMKKIHGLVWLVFKLHLLKRHYIIHKFFDTHFFLIRIIVTHTYCIYIFSFFSLHLIQFYRCNMSYCLNTPQKIYLFSWPWTYQLCPVFAVITFSHTLTCKDWQFLAI